MVTHHSVSVVEYLGTVFFCLIGSGEGMFIVMATEICTEITTMALAGKWETNQHLVCII